MRRPWGAPLLALLLVLTLGAPGRAEEPSFYPIDFPVVGESRFSDTWWAPRPGGRRHLGTDVMADKMTPVVAVADGTVRWMHEGPRCCAMGLLHDDGWESRYIHLNNDTPGTDDGRGWGFAEGIRVGLWVASGTLIGWVGDSGNAEGTAPHLHFELHTPEGRVINPYSSLLEAEVLEEPLPLPRGGPPVYDHSDPEAGFRPVSRPVVL